jgi:predicted Rossmann fold flavoprotein
LYSAFSTFGAKDTVAFFESIKLPIKVEAKNRAFPISSAASDVIHVLNNRLHRLGVNIVTGATVTKINCHGAVVESVETKNGSYVGHSYILATGGSSHPETGSTGDGFDWLRSLGHSVAAPSPSITPLALSDAWVASAAGISAKAASITFYADAKRTFKVTGDILFTHFGISGPIILNSAHTVDGLLQSGAVVTAKIDCMPGVDAKTLDNIIITTLHSNGTKRLKNTLQLFVPTGLSPVIKAALADQVNFETTASEVPKQTRKLLIEVIKSLPVHIDKLMGLDKAVVADGGVQLSEIDMRTMRSLKVSNLYITGDLLDINRPSGGFSLQLCWTTGHLAGFHATKLPKLALEV